MRYLLLIGSFLFLLSCAEGTAEATTDQPHAVADTEAVDSNAPALPDEDIAPEYRVSYTTITGEDDGREYRNRAGVFVQNREQLETTFPLIAQNYSPDFENNLVFVYSIGKHSVSSRCYWASIGRIYRENTTLRVETVYNQPENNSGCTCETSLSSPYVIALIPKTEIARLFPTGEYSTSADEYSSFHACPHDR